MGAALGVRTGFRSLRCSLLAMLVAGLAFGQKAAEGEFARQLQSVVGETGARAIQAILQNANRPALGIIASAMGMGTVLVGVPQGSQAHSAIIAKIFNANMALKVLCLPAGVIYIIPLF